ncbi:MAG: UvrB/UvrC motif-containing protein [Brotaphodocola sp.]
MLCERCKIREANIQYTEVIGGVKKEHHFCSQCAKELDFGPYSAIFDGEFPLGKLLSGLLGIDEEQKESSTSQIVCPTCGTSYDEFVKNSRFGCPDCYSIFDLLMSDKIKQLQGSEKHRGKQPKNRQNRASELNGEMSGILKKEEKTNRPEEQIRILEAKLKDAVRREEYESAAAYRDQIRALKEGKNDDKVV